MFGYVDSQYNINYISRCYNYFVMLQIFASFRAKLGLII